VIQRRYDPTLGEWRTFTAPRASPTEERCRYCPTTDPEQPTDIPAAAYQLAVLDDPFPALSPARDPSAVALDGIYQAQPAVGASEVVLYSDQHGRRLSELDDSHVARLVDVWADRYAVLGARDEIEYVFFFEDGTAEGVTAGHPYGQIHGYPEIPPLMLRELQAAVRHQQESGTCLFCDIVASERTDGRRVVAQNDSFLAFVPFAARFPYELHIYPQRHITSLVDCTDPERLALAGILRSAVRHRPVRDVHAPGAHRRRRVAVRQPPAHRADAAPVPHRDRGRCRHVHRRLSARTRRGGPAGGARRRRRQRGRIPLS
jgi:UDPglucose--hexose-1-phosphate uridylyltransferase